MIKAARRRQFYAVNHAGSAALADAVLAAAPAARFLHVSTIAAREPQLSDYAGSKRAGEDAVLQNARRACHGAATAGGVWARRPRVAGVLPAGQQALRAAGGNAAGARGA